MTPTMLQDELIEEIKRLLHDNLYKRPGTKELIPMNVFAQSIPVNETDDEDDPIPYVLVRLNSGKDIGTRDSNHTVKLVIVIGIWDDDLNLQGHRDVMNIIFKIYDRFQTNPNLNGVAVHSGEFNWALQEDAHFPYFFGACSLDFNIAAIRRGDKFV